MSEFHDRCSVFLYPEESVYPFTDLRVELPAPDTDKLKENLREVLNTIQNDVNRIIEGDIGGEIEGLVLDTAAGIIALNHSITVILIEEFRRMIATPGLAGDLFGSCDKAQRAAKDKKHITEMAFDLPPNEQSWRSNPIVYAKEHDFDTLRNSMYAVEFQIIDADGSLTGSTIILPVWIVGSFKFPGSDESRYIGITIDRIAPWHIRNYSQGTQDKSHPRSKDYHYTSPHYVGADIGILRERVESYNLLALLEKRGSETVDTIVKIFEAETDIGIFTFKGPTSISLPRYKRSDLYGLQITTTTGSIKYIANPFKLANLATPQTVIPAQEAGLVELTDYDMIAFDVMQNLYNLALTMGMEDFFLETVEKYIKMREEWLNIVKNDKRNPDNNSPIPIIDGISNLDLYTQ